MDKGALVRPVVSSPEHLVPGGCAADRGPDVRAMVALPRRGSLGPVGARRLRPARLPTLPLPQEGSP